MARLFRSPRAKRDVIEVLSYTRDRWGVAQARVYRDLILEALKTITEHPESGKVRSAFPGTHLDLASAFILALDVANGVGVTNYAEAARALREAMRQR
jgi:plasmid stabilization system protein ParE